MTPEIRVQRNARVIQVSNMTGQSDQAHLEPGGEAQTGADCPAIGEIGELIARTALTGKTLVVTNKPVRCALTGENGHSTLPISARYRGADVAHFGNIRGSNEFENHETVIILGRDEPMVQDAKQRGNGDLVRHEGADSAD